MTDQASVLTDASALAPRAALPTPGRPATVNAEEAARLRALARYAILDTPPDPAFDDIVELALAATGCPAAGIGFLDRDRLWFKATRGMEITGHEYVGSTGACVGALRGAGREGVVQEVQLSPIRHGDTDLEYFASAPCVTTDGYLLGHLFVMDRLGKELTEAQRTALVALARQVVRLLEMRRTMLSYHTIVDGVGHVVFHVDESNRLVSVTPTWSQLTGYGVVRSVGRRLQDFMHGDDRAAFAEDLAKVHAGETPAVLEGRLVRLSGGDVPVEVLARPLVDEQGRRLGVIGVIADVTDRKAREIEVQHAQRLEALGRLSAGIAHEINSPIQFVGDNTRFLAESCDAMLRLITTYRQCLDTSTGAIPWWERQELLMGAESEVEVDYLAEEVPTAVAQSLDGVERVASLVRAMKAFSHPGHGVQAPADLNAALTATLTVARNQIRSIADVTLDLGELPEVTCDIADLNQVFLNMIINAADAIEEKGTHGTITVRTWVEGADAVVSISDTGGGIPPGAELKIFEPFYTTKEVGRGTGQGLALARAVVQDKHEGTISLDSQVGVGTTFTIRLPIDGRQSGTGSS